MTKIKLLRILIPGLILAVTLSQTNILAKIRQGRSTAQAVGDLTIDWGVPSGQPIFTVNNLLPGQEEIRTVTITNNATISRPVGVRAVKTTETGNLAEALEIIISQNGNELYGGTTGSKTLAEFFAQSAGPDALPLFILNPGITTSTTFKVNFKPDAGNEYQNKTVVFDLLIGIAIPVPAECHHIKFTGKIIYGTQGNDKIKGTNHNDLIFGLEGDDDINGSNGDDCLVGGSGNDVLDGSNGDDVIFGNEGNDRLYGSNGNDFIFGGPGDDFIDGSNGADKIYGEEGDDRMLGKNGNDILLGGPGNDTADGGLNQDQCEAETKKACEL